MESLEGRYDNKTNGLIIFSHVYALEIPLGNIDLNITMGREETFTACWVKPLSH